MKPIYLFRLVFCLFVLLVGAVEVTLAAPQTTKVDYTDYLPKYRSSSDKYLFSKIDYTEEDMIVFFRYVAQKDNDIVTFYGAKTQNAWKLTTSTRSQASSAYSVTRLATIFNIRINDESKENELHETATKRLSTSKGDVITCEIHFKMMPRTVRSAHLLGGEQNKEGALRFSCNDLLLKTKDSNMLGTEDQMRSVIKRYYSKQESVNYPDINTVTTREVEKILEKKEEEPKIVKNPLAHSLEPIDYMPKSMKSVEDIECNERVILTNVYFHDNKADFAGRVRAMKTINIIVDYLAHYKEAKIVLHGHTDIFGNSFKNLELSKNRVWTVKRAIVSKGIESNRIITVHHGGAQPLIQYKSGGEMNRRVEAELLCSGSK